MTQRGVSPLELRGGRTLIATVRFALCLGAAAAHPFACPLGLLLPPSRYDLLHLVDRCMLVAACSLLVVVHGVVAQRFHQKFNFVDIAKNSFFEPLLVVNRAYPIGRFCWRPPVARWKWC